MDKIKTESRYSQCSYNALATVLNYFYGDDVVEDDKWEFVNGRPSMKTPGVFYQHMPDEYKGFYGWIPYGKISLEKMMEDGIEWNGSLIDIECETFAIEGGEIEYKGDAFTQLGQVPVYDITFKDGELEEITRGLAAKLEEGPCFLWIPWAAHWGNISNDGNVYRTTVMPNVTHAIVLESYNKETNEFCISDNSVQNGTFDVSPEDIITKLLAMPELQKGREARGGAPLKGIEGAKYHTRIRKNK